MAHHPTAPKIIKWWLKSYCMQNLTHCQTASAYLCVFITVINGEKASYCTPTFSEKRNRTLSLLLKDVEHKCTTEV